MQVRINNNTFNVKTLTDQKSKSIGMMGKRFDSTFDGLLFLMGGDEQSFWMKNCIIPLDIVFINDDMTIQSIQKNCPPCSSNDCEHYPGNGKYVLELAGGTCEECGIENGQKIKISY
jgi:uncharacterized membrane protein (UPF0127 family)